MKNVKLAQVKPLYTVYHIIITENAALSGECEGVPGHYMCLLNVDTFINTYLPSTQTSHISEPLKVL